MRTILLSFQSEWYEKLVAGKMKFEYRMVLPKEETIVYFYVSKPIMAITGVAHFGARELLEDWLESYGKKNTETKKRIQNYMADCKYAARIYSYQETNAIKLQQLRKDIKGFAPPRMYYFIDETEDLLKQMLLSGLHFLNAEI